MEMEVRNVEARVKFFDAVKGFGFFTTEQFNDVFVHFTKLGTFKPWELQKDSLAVISFTLNPKEGKYQVTEIHQVNLCYLKQQGDTFALPQPQGFEEKPYTATTILSKGDHATGEVSDVREGFGFLRVEGVVRPLFFHRTQLPQGVKAEMGQIFNFVVDENEKGLIAIKLSFATAFEDEVPTADADEPSKHRVVRRRRVREEEMAAE